MSRDRLDERKIDSWLCRADIQILLRRSATWRVARKFARLEAHSVRLMLNRCAGVRMRATSAGPRAVRRLVSEARSEGALRLTSFSPHHQAFGAHQRDRAA